MDSLSGVAALTGIHVTVPHLNVVRCRSEYPSHTFHTITYVVDSYRGTIKPTRNLFEFVAYVSLFSPVGGRSDRPLPTD
jgi:hypothetical protein